MTEQSTRGSVGSHDEMPLRGPGLGDSFSQFPAPNFCRSDFAPEDESFSLGEAGVDRVDPLMRHSESDQDASRLWPGFASNRRRNAVCVELITARGLAQDELGVVVEVGAGCRSGYA